MYICIDVMILFLIINGKNIFCKEKDKLCPKEFFKVFAWLNLKNIK